MSIKKLFLPGLRNAEFYQFMVSAFALFVKFGLKVGILGSVYDEVIELLKSAAEALAVERKIALIQEKNDMDRTRDRLHSSLFNFLKSILYNEKDDRYDDALQVMTVMKSVGNPSQLPENVQSAMLTALFTKLEAYEDQLRNLGMDNLVADLMNANQRFILLERECREILSERKLNPVLFMNSIRKEITPRYRAVVDIVNAYVSIPSKNEEYKELISEMNVLITKYENLILIRQREKKEKEEEAAGGDKTCDCPK